MWYSIACTLIVFFAFWRFNRNTALAFGGSSKAEGVDWKRMAGAFLLFIVPAFLTIAPVITTIIDTRHWLRSEVLPSKGTISVVISLIGGACVLIVALGSAIRHRFKPSFWFKGWLLLSTLSAIVIMVATIEQLSFVGGTNVSSVDFNYVKPLVKDMHCASDVLLVHWKYGDTAVTYRCPTRLMFNNFSERPFMPWPDYTEGKSTDLAEVLNNMQ